MFRSINSKDDKADLLLENQCLLPSALFSVNLSLSYSHRLVSEFNLVYGKEQEVLKWNQCITGTFFIHVNTWRPSVWYTHKLEINNNEWSSKLSNTNKRVGKMYWITSSLKYVSCILLFAFVWNNSITEFPGYQKAVVERGTQICIEC